MAGSPVRDDLDLLCIGEAMLVLRPIDGSIETAGAFAASVGGAEANVAVALARAGRRVGWASAVGADPIGRRIVAHLAGAGVDASLVGVGRASTGLYFRDAVPAPGGEPLYYRAGSAASQLDADDALRWAGRVDPRVVHVSGVTAVLSASTARLCRAVTSGRVFGDAMVSFDVNHRRGMSDARTPELLLEFARASDVVFVGRDESARLWGTTDCDSVRTLLPEPSVLVVKDAEIEAVEYAGDTRATVPAVALTVVEPTGAGDAFAAGWLDAWVSGDGPEERLRSGHRAASAALRSLDDVAREEAL